MFRHGGVDDEAAILGVLKEDAVQARRVAIGPRDGRGEIVDDEAAHDAVEEGPGGFEALEHSAEILPQADGQKRVATEAQRDKQSIDAAAPRGIGISLALECRWTPQWGA